MITKETQYSYKKKIGFLIIEREFLLLKGTEEQFPIPTKLKSTKIRQPLNGYQTIVSHQLKEVFHI
jgi:hypothetical protein